MSPGVVGVGGFPPGAAQGCNTFLFCLSQPLPRDFGKIA